jgi:hypothetical protein
MSTEEKPSALLRRIYDEEFGFLPTNSSMKPVHVANGMARRLLGQQHDFVPLAKVLRQFVDNQKGGFKEERFPNDLILSEYGSRFEDAYHNNPSDDSLTRFRALAKDTLGADDAVFPTQASFTLSHERMVTADISDNGSGELLAALLTGGGEGITATAAEVFREFLRSNTDPWSTLAWPLLDLLEPSEATISDSMEVRAQRRNRILAVDERGEFLSPTLRELRARYDQLAAYERDHGSKLTALRRMVLFGVFAIHIHMIRRAHDVTAAAPLPPLLLDMFDGRRRSLRDASAATLQGGFRAIEHLVVHRITQELAESVGDDPAAFVANLPSEPEWDAVRVEYSAHAGSHEPIEALSEAYWKVGYSSVGPKEVQGFPWNTLLALGRRSGFLMPYDNRGRGGKEHKRYGATAEFAEMLVISTVRPDEPVDFDEFLERLRTSYGIVMGGPYDFAAIRANDLRDGTGGNARRSTVSVLEADLRQNMVAFRDLIIDIGFAKAYADGRTVVTTAEVNA